MSIDFIVIAFSCASWSLDFYCLVREFSFLAMVLKKSVSVYLLLFMCVLGGSW